MIYLLQNIKDTENSEILKSIIKRPLKVVVYEFIEYSKERIRVYFTATSLLPKPISEFIDFAAAIAIARLFFEFFIIIAAAFDMFEESIEYLFIIMFTFYPFAYMNTYRHFFQKL